MNSDTWEYEIECLNPTDYILNITMHTKNRLIQTIFAKAKAKLRKKHIDVRKSPDSIDEFDIPKQYINLVKVSVNKPINMVKDEVNRDGIGLLTHYIQKAKFKRNKKNREIWDILIEISGQYVDRR